MWKPGRSSTASRLSRLGLWEAVDCGGTAAAVLTCGDVVFSTIHSTYYCCWIYI